MSLSDCKTRDLVYDREPKKLYSRKRRNIGHSENLGNYTYGTVSDPIIYLIFGNPTCFVDESDHPQYLQTSQLIIKEIAQLTEYAESSHAV